MGKLIIVDCEHDGPCPGKGNLTEIGAVFFHDTSKRFYGALRPMFPGKSIESYKIVAKQIRMEDAEEPKIVMEKFAAWIKEVCGEERPIFVSDNPASDFQWINYYFWHTLDNNPFGWSGRRIGDIYAGVVGDLRRPWKGLRKTVHDHNPVNDALGNAEALEEILKMMETKNGKSKNTKIA